MSRYTSATDADRREMLDAIGVELDRRAVRRRAGGRPPRPRRSTSRPGKPEQEVYARLRDLAARNVSHRGRDQLPRRRDVRPLRPEPDRLDPLAAREFLTPYTPYQPEISQGGLQVMFEYQTAISRAHRPAGLQRERLRGPVRARRRRLPGEAAQQAHALPDLRRRAPARPRDAGDDRAPAGARPSRRSRSRTASRRRPGDRRRRLRRARAVPELPRRRRGPPGAHRRRPRGRRADDRRSATR